jgi:hypothetical protein
MKMQFSLTGFLEARFLLISSSPRGFQVNGPQIRTRCFRKHMMTCLLFDYGVLLSSSPILMNAAILRLVAHAEGPCFGWRTHAFWKRNNPRSFP